MASNKDLVNNEISKKLMYKAVWPTLQDQIAIYQLIQQLFQLSSTTSANNWLLYPNSVAE
jgi:hypothetical protein